MKSAITTIQEAVALVRKGLTMQCQVPVEYFPPPNLTPLKRLAQAIAADGRLAEGEGRLDDAAKDYASIIALGSESARGGSLIHCLAQIAIEYMGTASLRPVVPTLDVDGAKQTLQILQRADSDRDTFDQVRAHEHQYYLHTPLRERLASLPLHLLRRDPYFGYEIKLEKKYDASQTAILKLEGQLAAHVFKLQNSRAATNWDDLVPAYLASIPNDPTKNRPMAFDSW